MAAKILQNLADDSSDLQRQIGCMTGIFQPFDGQHIIMGRRITHRRLPPGNSSRINTGNFGSENDDVSSQDQIRSGMALNESMNEGQGGNTESSRSSFVSSQTSSPSSMECNRISHPEYSSSNRIIASETPSRNPIRNHYNNTSSHLVKKEEERLVLSVKTIMGKEEDPEKHRIKQRDSPRPPKNQSKLIMEGTLQTNGKQKNNIKESLRVLSELRDEFSRSSYEASRYGTSKVSPRFSYDGRERNRLSFESQSLNRSGLKIKELPRLSLDSREGSVRSSKSAPDPSWLSSNSSFNPQSRPTSVVVKLMGLEPLPVSSTLTSDTKSDNGSLDTKSLTSPIRVFRSPKNSLKAPTSPRWKNPDIIMKPTSSLKFPVEEAAPWRQQSNGNPGSNKPGLRPVKGAARTSNDFPSVYGEIEKRLQHLEFKKSGKDLRALKKMLEALQTKGLLETRKEEQVSNFGTNRDYYRNKQSNQVVSSSKPSKSPTSRAYESPIVIIKPGKLVEKSGLLPSNKKSSSNNTNSFRDSVKSSSRKQESSKVVRTTKQSSSRPQQIPKESNVGSSSPRIQQKKVDLEKRSRPPTPPASRRGSNKQEKNLGGARQGLRRKQNQRSCTNLVPCEDQLSEVSNESRGLSCQGDDMSEQSDGNLSLELKKDIEVSSIERLIDVNSSSMSLRMKAEEFLVHGSMENNSRLRCDEDSFQSEFKTIAPEQPSPISVLDPAVYRDDELSPMKDSSDNLDEDEWNLPTKITRKKLQNIDNLVQKLRRLNSHHDEGKTDYIALLCENTDPDKRYVSEILLASGLLLRDLGSNLTTFQLHSSSHPINPELFLVLEQTKASRKNLPITEKKLKWDPEKFHRKLIFDVTNEILSMKLASVGPASEPWVTPKKLAKRDVSAQRILKDLCFEIERFQGMKRLVMEEGEEEEDGLESILKEDVMRRTGNWTDFEGEISGMVLDVERLIFKDLVSETVNGEMAQFRAKKLTRQLFS